MSKDRAVELSPIWIRPTGVVPRLSDRVSAAMGAPSSNTAVLLDAPATLTLTCKSCHAAVLTTAVLDTDVLVTSLRVESLPVEET